MRELFSFFWDHCLGPALALIGMIGVHVILDVLLKKFKDKMGDQTILAFKVCSFVTLWSSVALFVIMIVCLSLFMGGDMIWKLKDHKFGPGGGTNQVHEQ